MKFHALTLALATLLAQSATLPSAAAQSDPSDGFKSLSNGEDLAGWTGDPRFWSVRDGIITGQTTAEAPAENNTFLIWTEDAPANFELRLSFRLSAQNDDSFANSGIQYRSELADPERFIVGGYQADLDLSGKYTGMLYEERGRGIVMMPGESVRLAPAPASSDEKATVEKLVAVTPPEAILDVYRIGQWNEFSIVAKGNRLRHYLNGVLTADVTDADPAHARSTGIIALQLHRGEPMTVEFRDLKLKKLP